MTKLVLGDNQAGYAAFGRAKWCLALVLRTARNIFENSSPKSLKISARHTECANADETGSRIRESPSGYYRSPEYPPMVSMPATFSSFCFRRKFSGKVSPSARRERFSSKRAASGQEYGLAMLPPLTTPFSAEIAGADSIRSQRTGSEPGGAGERGVGTSLARAMVQGKIDARTLAHCGAEASVRMRHPNWGVVTPAYFIPEDEDPDLLQLSDFVIDALSRMALFGRIAKYDRHLNQPAGLFS